MKTILYSSLLTLTATAIAQESYVAFDTHSGKVFFASETEKKRPVASLTKVAAAKVVLDWAAVSKTSLDTLILVPDSVSTVTGASPLKLQAGDALTIRDAVYAMLLSSDNAAAHTLANSVGYAINQKRGKQQDPVSTFVREMNQLAKALGMKNTTFVNPHGLTNSQQNGASTATDMAILTLAALQSEAIVFMVKQKSRNISVKKSGKQAVPIKLTNTNTLLGKHGIVGLKTGHTNAAGQCLITVADRPPLVTETAGNGKRLRPRQMVIVLLGSADRFPRTETLLTSAWSSYDQWSDAGALVPASGKGLLQLPKAFRPAPQPPSAAPTR